MVKVCFLSGLREVVEDQEIQVSCPGRISDLLKKLCNCYGEPLRQFLFDRECPDQRSPFVKILVNGRDIKGTDPRLNEDDTIFLFLPIAGG